MAVIQRISPCLWFDNQAEEAAKFYASVFKNSRIVLLLATALPGRRSTRRRQAPS